MYELFYDGNEPPKLPKLPKGKIANDWGTKGKDARLLANFCQLFSHVNKDDLKMMLLMTQKMATRKS